MAPWFIFFNSVIIVNQFWWFYLKLHLVTIMKVCTLYPTGDFVGFPYPFQLLSSTTFKELFSTTLGHLEWRFPLPSSKN